MRRTIGVGLLVVDAFVIALVIVAWMEANSPGGAGAGMIAILFFPPAVMLLVMGSVLVFLPAAKGPATRPTTTRFRLSPAGVPLAVAVMGLSLAVFVHLSSEPLAEGFWFWLAIGLTASMRAAVVLVRDRNQASGEVVDAATSPPRASRLAKVAFGFAIAGFFFLPFPGVGWILALIQGYRAREEIGSSAGQETARDLADTSIIIGWIGLGFLVAVIVLLICAPAFSGEPP